jgi:hypothetical protein
VGVGRRYWEKIINMMQILCTYTYINGNMRTVETISEVGGGGKGE